MAAVVTHHSLGAASGARGVENVEWVGGVNRHAISWCGYGHGLMPVQVTASGHGGFGLGALQHNGPLRLMFSLAQRFVQQRLIGNDITKLNATGSRHHHFRLGVIDADSQLMGGKTAKHHGMNCP